MISGMTRRRSPGHGNTRVSGLEAAVKTLYFQAVISSVAQNPPILDHGTQEIYIQPEAGGLRGPVL
jgi:hypothetical protein